VASSSTSGRTARNPPPQSLYDAVARRSLPDRYLSRPRFDPENGKLNCGKPVAPEQVLASRWGRQLKRIRKQSEDEAGNKDDDGSDQNTKLIQNGLALSGERNDALPDSVRPLLE